MDSNTARVKEFHEAFGHPVADEMSNELLTFRYKLMLEELDEVEEAMRGVMIDLLSCGAPTLANVAHLLKELADLQYVLSGTAVALGMDLEECVRLVHISNMSKLGPDGKPLYREDGKILKGPDYVEPNMTTEAKKVVLK